MYFYYVVNIQITNEEKSIQSIFSYDNEFIARSTYHNTLASNYASDKLSRFSVVLMDEKGTVLLSESFYKPVVETDTEQDK